MADLEDRRETKPAPVNGVSDDTLGFDGSSLGLDASHVSKFSDPHSQDPFDLYTSQPSSMMADKDYGQSSYGHDDYEDENDVAPAHQGRDQGHFQDEQYDDLPANFAKEAARHQNFPESDNFDDEAYVRGQSEGRDDESEEVVQRDSNPFAVDDVKKPTGVTGGAYVDTSDRPIVGYNPFLNEEAAYEKEEEDTGDEHGGVSQEDNEQYQGGPEGESGEREYGDGREGHSEYDRFEDEEEDSYHQRETAQRVQHYEYEEVGGRTDAAGERHSEDEKTEEQSEDEVQSPGEFPDKYIHSEDTQAFQQEESKVPGKHDSADFESGQYDDTAYNQPEQPGDFDEYPDTRTSDTNYKAEVYEEDQRDESENIPQQSGQTEEDDLGIVNQGFSDDADLEGGKIIPEEEEVTENEAPTSTRSAIIDTELYEDRREGRPEERREEVETDEEPNVLEGEKQYDDEEEDYSRQHEGEQVNEDDYEKEKIRQEEEMEYASATKTQEPEDEDYSSRQEEYRDELGEGEDEEEEMENDGYTQKEKLKSEAADIYQSALTKADYKQINYDDDDEEETDQTGERNDDFVADQVKAGEKQSYRDSSTVDDYTAQYLRADEDMDHTTSTHGGDDSEPRGKRDEEDSYAITGENEYSSRSAESESLSAERSYVDNLSDVTSPETIPQPLPSPPEPKNLSSFDPLAASDSTSPGPEPVGNLGQHGALFEHGLAADETNTADFLTAGEVEGETKFGVDGTAITSTSQNNAFLHSDEEDDEDDEEESQHLDQGQTGTTATTETETSVDDKSAEYEAQHGADHMEGNDNALMSMSMEGSFYDDGGELIGGEDKKNQHENHFYEERSFAEESSLLERLEPKQESYLENRDQLLGDIIQEDSSVDHDSYQPQDDFDVRGSDVDVEPHISDAVPPASEENGVHYDEDKPGGFDSEVDTLVPERVPQTLAVEPHEVADSFLDHTGVDFTANESESSVDSQHPHVHDVESPKDLEDTVSGVEISDASPEKAEEPAASVAETPAAGKEESSGAAPETAAPEAAAATAIGVAVAAAAAAAATTKTTTTVKKTSAKAGGKTTTTTTTKVTKETKAAAGKVATTKKAEITTTATSKTTTRKPAEPRPTSAATTEKKAPAKTTTSPTKPSSATPATARSSVTAPSCALPAATRKPKEVKPATPEEKKKPTTTTTPRTPLAAHRTPRPQSATATTSSTSSTTAAGTTATTKTTTRTTVTSSTTRTTAPLSRPKSSPTKLTNGTASNALDTKSPAKKPGVDSKTGSARTPAEKKEVKTTPRVDAGSKSTTPAAATRSPTKTTTTPRTPATPKSGEVRSKIGSMENATHTPGGGHVRIASKKPDFSNVTSKVGSKDKIDHKPGGGNIRIETKKVKVEAKSKVGSLNNTTHKPGGGDKKIEVQKTEWKAQSKIGSLDNVKHKPGGGDNQTESQKTSLDKQGPGSGSEQGAIEVQNGAASEN